MELLQADLGSVSADAIRTAHRVRLLFWICLALTVAFAAGAIALAGDRRRAVSALGIGVAIAGVVLIVAWSVGRSLVTGSFDGPDEQAASGAVWDAFLGDLRTAGWILAGSGAVVAAAAASLIKPVELEPRLRRPRAGSPPSLSVRGRVQRGPRRSWRWGCLVLANRSAVIDLLVALAGVYLIYKGVEALLR